MSSANGLPLPGSGPMVGWVAGLTTCVTVFLAWCSFYGFTWHGSGLQIASETLTVLTIVAIGGLFLLKPGALWLTLIVVSCDATVALFFWSMNFNRLLIVLATAALTVISVLTFRLSPPVGPRVGLYQRILFGCVLVFAAWVAFWGLFRTSEVARAIPFPVPPLHARFLGAMYLSGAVFMFLGMLGRQWHEIRVVTAILAVWTGMLGIVSLFHLKAFDWSRTQVWFWFVAYICYPLLALWIAWRQRGEDDHPGGSALADVLRSYLYLQGAVAVLLALALLFAPHFMTTVWPWKIPLAVAQIYGAPFLSYGVGSLYAARQGAWSEVRIVVLATFVFAAAVLTASRIHSKLFNFHTPSAWIWFGGFGFVSAALLLFAFVPSLRTRA